MKRTKIVTIRQAQNGNYLINGNSQNPIWVNGGEMRSLLLGYNLDANSPAILLIGSTITYEEKIITQDDITNNTNKVKLAVPRTIRTGARAGEVITHITYATVGSKQFNFGLELSDRLWKVVADQSIARSLEKNEKAAEDRLGQRSLTNDEVVDDNTHEELLNEPVIEEPVVEEPVVEELEPEL